MHNLKQHWSNLRSSFWFLPSLIVLVNIIFAIVFIEADSAGIDRWLARWPRLFGAGAEGSRQMLATLAGSMMTVLGVTFSMTLVALTLASSQYTSRILRNFMRSKVTQGTLGTFAGTFVYCLVVLRTIRSGGGAEFVPGLAVFFAFVLALGSVGVLIFFIHHIATSIQASSIISTVARETITSIDRLFMQKIGQDPAVDEDEDRQLRLLAEKHWRPVPARISGYIQSVDGGALIRLASRGKTILRMEQGVGDFVVRGTPLASLAKEAPLDLETLSAVNEAYHISSHRTVDQDPAYGIRQIVDMALKALSPGVNDTSTAVMCIDYLSMILAHLVTKAPLPLGRYQDGELRILNLGSSFASLLAESFDQIRSSAAGNVAIMARMLSALEAIASLTDSSHSRRVLSEQLQWIAELARRSIDSTHDRQRIERRLKEVQDRLCCDPPILETA